MWKRKKEEKEKSDVGRAAILTVSVVRATHSLHTSAWDRDACGTCVCVCSSVLLVNCNLHENGIESHWFGVDDSPRIGDDRRNDSKMCFVRREFRWEICDTRCRYILSTLDADAETVFSLVDQAREHVEKALRRQASCKRERQPESDVNRKPLRPFNLSRIILLIEDYASARILNCMIGEVAAPFSPYFVSFDLFLF